MDARRALAAVAITGWLTPAVHAQTAGASRRAAAARRFITSPTDALRTCRQARRSSRCSTRRFAELISDRVDAGSLTVGQARAHGRARQLVDADDVPYRRRGYFRSARERHAARSFPGVHGWQRMDVATGAMPLDMNSPGPVDDARAGRPGAVVDAIGRVLRRARLACSPARETTDPPGDSAPRRMELRERAGERARSSRSAPGWSSRRRSPTRTHFQRDDPTLLRDQLGFAVHESRLHAEPRATRFASSAGLQRTRSPFDTPPRLRSAGGRRSATTSVHLQSEWERPRNAESPWTGFASFSAQRRTTDLERVPATVMERLTTGPSRTCSRRSEPTGPGRSEGSWRRSHGTGGTPLKRVSTLSGGSESVRAPFPVRIGELVDGQPARVWDYSVPAGAFQWRQITLSAYAGDTVILNPAPDGRRRSALRARERGAVDNPQGVSWHDWYPSLGLRWEMHDFKRIAALVRFNRYGYRLSPGIWRTASRRRRPRTCIAGRRPAAIRASRQLGALVSRVGPGTGGDAAFSALDPQLERPYVNELTFGFESRPDRSNDRPDDGGRPSRGPAGRRRQYRRPDVVIYCRSPCIDPGVDHGGGQTLVVFNRPPAAFGADRYLLTNPDGHHATFAGVDITVQTTQAGCC